MTGKPTPTPWAIFKAGIGEENGDGIASLWREGDEREANAALIVRAVNAHDALVKALKTALGVVDQGRRIDSEQAHYLRVQFKAALALAGEAP